ncbi:MAG: hypothetical protein K8Q92_05660 [Methylophilales bacterium]|nr:hypothetical protein [Methylophilales bacterium]
MKVSKLSTALLMTGAIALPAMSVSADEVYYETAQVISVNPRTETINVPHQECRTEYEQSGSSYNSGERNIGGSIIGGIAGGLLGGTVGKGKGRIVTSAIGAATGAIVGDRLGNSNNGYNSYSTRPIERCHSEDSWQTVTRGYLVTYRYNGRDYTTVMPNDPGETIRMRVTVAPEIGVGRTSYLEPSYRDYGRDWDNRRGRGGWGN